MAIRDSRTGVVSWDYTDEIDIVSTFAMPPDEQLSQLLAGLKTFVEEESGFFTQN